MRPQFLMIVLIVSPIYASSIVEVCPHPATNGAEYVKLYLDSNCTLSDGEGRMDLVGRGIVYIAKNSKDFKRVFGFEPNMTFKNGIGLSNSGDEVMLLENGSIVDEFVYRRCHIDEVFFKRNGSWDFRYIHWTSLKPVKDHVHGVLIETPAKFKVDADIVVSYTVKDPDTVNAKEFILDGNPVGGVPLIEKGLENVTFLKSYDFRHFHWKFALKGDTVIITTENWGWNRKGYIVEFESARVTNLLRAVIAHDRMFSTSDVRYRECGVGKGFGMGRRCEFDADVEVFVLPDSNPIYDFIKSAKRRLVIEAPYITDPKIKALIERKAENVSTIVITREPVRLSGVNVKTDRNLHGKIIVADDRVLITTANFDFSGMRLNREIAIVIYDKKVADFVCGRNDYELLLTIVLMGVAVAIIYKKVRG